jgi:hypothetical protein
VLLNNLPDFGSLFDVLHQIPIFGNIFFHNYPCFFSFSSCSFLDWFDWFWILSNWAIKLFCFYFLLKLDSMISEPTWKVHSLLKVCYNYLRNFDVVVGISTDRYAFMRKDLPTHYFFFDTNSSAIEGYWSDPCRRLKSVLAVPAIKSSFLFHSCVTWSKAIRILCILVLKPDSCFCWRDLMFDFHSIISSLYCLLIFFYIGLNAI